MPTRNFEGYYDADTCDLEAFKMLIGREPDRDATPRACNVQSKIPIYDMADLAGMLEQGASRRALMAEWAQVLGQGAGVVVLKGAYTDTSPLDAATDVYEQTIAAEKAANQTAADHFAAAGSNDRVWNSLQKLGQRAPEVFLRYFANPALDAMCEAWLGPNYQMTAQVNLVHPGGQAQQAHRDYHLGFQSAEVSATYPVHVHDLSPLMTLQGAIAHCDIPVEAGPTKLLPYSQLYRAGYAAWRRAAFRACFEAQAVQLPLAKGDAVFFSPALFHAAGSNVTSDIHRMVNLLQVSSAFGRAMETVDRLALSKTLFGPMVAAWRAGRLTEAQLDAAIAATAEGYSFPTNLDTDPPVGGLAPQSQQALLRQAVTGDWAEADIFAALDAQELRKKA